MATYRQVIRKASLQGYRRERLPFIYQTHEDDRPTSGVAACIISPVISRVVYMYMRTRSDLEGSVSTWRSLLTDNLDSWYGKSR